MRGRSSAARRASEKAIATAWHVEAFHRTKRLPRLQSLFRKRSPENDIEDFIAGMERLAVKGLVTVKKGAD